MSNKFWLIFYLWFVFSSDYFVNKIILLRITGGLAKHCLFSAHWLWCQSEGFEWISRYSGRLYGGHRPPSFTMRRILFCDKQRQKGVEKREKGETHRSKHDLKLWCCSVALSLSAHFIKQYTYPFPRATWAKRVRNMRMSIERQCCA